MRKSRVNFKGEFLRFQSIREKEVNENLCRTLNLQILARFHGESSRSHSFGQVREHFRHYRKNFLGTLGQTRL